MSDPKTERANPLGGPVAALDQPRFGMTEIVAAGLSLVWLAGVILWFTRSEGASSPLWLKLALVLGPVVLIWAVALGLRTIRGLRHEAERLQMQVEQLRASQRQHKAQPRPAVPRAEEPIRVPEPPVHFTTTRREEPRDPEPGLGLDAAPEDSRPPMAIEDFIRAVNFPENGDDHEGFRCLRLALADREAARLIRSAQDVLTLLAQDGIYVDDLVPDRAKPEVWRRFAAGERGRTIAALGGIRDRSSLALTAGRMRTDTIFRDAAHHFLRQYDRSYQAFEKSATDQDIAEMADTRTSRAFMLFGRVTGVFD